jgi:4-hydroxy-tetrahydrodipicolinate synthase
MADLGLRGVFTALVTPFVQDGSKVDFAAYEKLVNSQIASGISGLVPCGTTGESPTLTDGEQGEVIKCTVKFAKGRVPVLAGTGSNSTQKTIDASRAAFEAGADGVMIVMPYYNKPSQEGLIRHVTMVAKAVAGPVVLYNIPGRAAIDLSVDSVLRILDANPNVTGLKDATNNVLYCQELLRQTGDRISVVSGDDVLTLPLMSVGAKGVISVTSNVYPKQVADSVRAVQAGNWEEARRRHFALLPVHRALFAEPNPAPAKAALAQQGHGELTVRPPLIEASESCRTALAEAMRAFEAT